MNNPYLQRYLELGGGDPLKWDVYDKRHSLVKKYAWAIPDEDAIDLIVKYSPIIEMGAGTGYWASLISEKGGDIICFDECPPHPLNLYGENYYKHSIQYYPVQKGTPRILPMYSERSLMICWAPYDTPMAFDCITHYKGDIIIWVGEGESGCNGTKAFFEILFREFEEIESESIPQWQGIHDYVTIWRRVHDL